MALPEAQDSPNWVFWSTRESIDNDIPSVTAIIETIVAVPLYWWIAVHFETYLPLLVSAAVAPLVLLRSDQSVELGVKWFTAWNVLLEGNTDRDQLPPGKLGATLSVGGGLLFAATAIYFLSWQFLAPLKGWSAFWGGFSVGILLLSVAAAGALTAVGVMRGDVPRTIFIGVILGTIGGVGGLIAAITVGLMGAESATVMSVLAGTALPGIFSSSIGLCVRGNFFR